jgi:hydroxypyruvate isomerase
MSTSPASGIRVSNFSGQRQGDLIDASTHHLIEADLKSSTATAKVLGNSILMVLTNELGDEGVVVHQLDEIPAQEKRRNCVSGLQKLMKLLPSDMKLVIEPLNTELDHVGYFLPDLETAKEMIDEIGDDRLKILCDFYHQGMTGDDPEVLIANYAEYIGYVHVADYPGRNEPPADSRRWLAILDRLGNAGYDGFVGFEFAPKGDSDAALESIYSLWKNL